MFNMLAVLSEFEREMIIERTNAGLAVARIRGRNGGRPKKDEEDIERALKLYRSQEYSKQHYGYYENDWSQQSDIVYKSQNIITKKQDITP